MDLRVFSNEHNTWIFLVEAFVSIFSFFAILEISASTVFSL